MLRKKYPPQHWTHILWYIPQTSKNLYCNPITYPLQYPKISTTTSKNIYCNVTTRYIPAIAFALKESPGATRHGRRPKLLRRPTRTLLAREQWPGGGKAWKSDRPSPATPLAAHHPELSVITAARSSACGQHGDSRGEAVSRRIAPCPARAPPAPWRRRCRRCLVAWRRAGPWCDASLQELPRWRGAEKTVQVSLGKNQAEG